MKVTISQTSLRRADWLRVFGDVAIEVQPAAPGKYRVDIAALKILQRQRLALHMSTKYKVVLDYVFKRGIVLPAADVVVEEELFP